MDWYNEGSKRRSRVFSVWKNVLTEIEGKLDRSLFVTYFRGVELLGVEDGVATVGVPDVFKKINLEKKYKETVLAALKNNGAEVEKVEFKVDKKMETHEEGGVEIKRSTAKRSGKVGKVGETLPLATAMRAKSANTNLNPKYTLDNFIIGSNNDLAVSVAKAVVERPGEKYNPFFLYGGPGLGKTHLVQAIGNELAKRNPKLKILYTPVNHFYSEYIKMVQSSKREDFAEKYRKLDVLIIDDFQMIIGKEASQEQFFNIFNDLYQANKQIIITSDRLPGQIKTLDERLASRLAMAGAIDLQMPNFEDKCAILKSKADFLGAEIEDEAIEFIAEEIKTNIRDLESELSRILAVSELRGMSPLQLIEDGYTSVTQTGGRIRSVTPRKILDKTAKQYGLEVEELRSKSRVSNIKTARQVAMFLLSKELGMSTNKIASEVGVKDHTTVMHGVKKIEGDIKKDFQLREEIEAIKEKIYE